MSNRAFTCMIPLFLLCTSTIKGQEASVPLTFDQSLELLQENNKSIQIAKKEVDIARSEHQRLNSFWYPNISAAGTYMHMSNKIEVKEPLNQLTDPVKELVQSHFPGTEITQIISGLLDKVGAYNLSFPLAPQNVATIDANLMWPIFTGGKRIYGNKIGKSMVSIAQLNHHQISALSQVMLVDTYYALRLGKRVVEVKKEAYDALYKEYQNALKLEQNGMINKAERLVVQVGMEEAKREHEAAVKDYSVAQSAFRGLLNMKDTTSVEPTSALFINDTIPSSAYFKSLIPQNNYMLAELTEQKKIAKYQENIGKTGYAPNIALIGKQTIYSHGIEKNLIPRSMIGVGFTWNIFDGLDREKKIKQARLAGQTLQLGKEKALSEIHVGIDKFYSQMQNAFDNVRALNTTIELSKELLKMRQKSFVEGMATSTEVVDAQVMLSKVQVAYLLAYYQYDSALMNLLSLCGTPEEFNRYRSVGKTEHFIFE
ncbi:MAG: TolC family protein [Bacteroidales bacterium]